MSNPAMRCRDCGSILHFAFVDDITGDTVYQCRSVGVQTERTFGRDTRLIHTLDHSDRFYTWAKGALIRVEPVRLSHKASGDVFAARDAFVYERGDDGKPIVPVAWTTRHVA